MTIYPIVYFKKSSKKYDCFEVVEDCNFEHENISFIVPKGFITDFSSVPQVFWSLIPAHCNASMPSVIHDYICQFAVLPRYQCDAIFLKLLKLEKIASWQYNLMYAYVRIFGWITYNKIQQLN